MKKRGRPRKDQKARMVRCLGPGEEHTFLSPDPTNVRVCPACRPLIRHYDRIGRVVRDAGGGTRVYRQGPGDN